MAEYHVVSKAMGWVDAFLTSSQNLINNTIDSNEAIKNLIKNVMESTDFMLIKSKDY